MVEQLDQNDLIDFDRIVVNLYNCWLFVNNSYELMNCNLDNEHLESPDL